MFQCFRQRCCNYFHRRGRGLAGFIVYQSFLTFVHVPVSLTRASNSKNRPRSSLSNFRLNMVSSPATGDSRQLPGMSRVSFRGSLFDATPAAGQVAMRRRMPNVKRTDPSNGHYQRTD